MRAAINICNFESQSWEPTELPAAQDSICDNNTFQIVEAPNALSLGCNTDIRKQLPKQLCKRLLCCTFSVAVEVSRSHANNTAPCQRAPPMPWEKFSLPAC